MWFEAICAFWEKKRERAWWFTHAVCIFEEIWIVLHLQYIIIILPVPDWDGAAACHAKPLTAGASSAWDRFMRSAFIKPPIKHPNYRPIVIGSWSVGAPLLLEDEPSPPVWGPERSGAGFHQGCLCTLLHSCFPRSWLVSQSLPLKNIPTAWCSMIPCTVGLVMARWWAELASFKHDAWNWGSSDQRILFLRVWEFFRCFVANSKCFFMCLHWGEDWVWPHRRKAQIGGVLQWCLSFCRSPHMIMELN